ncbi:MAG: MFS transporter [Alphaproteobacteria bacterium]|nr:MFS transporter [Alphaproteobacteria bacterium]NNF24489.1 MFS transporter [Paracoccaceae bacterium]
MFKVLGATWALLLGMMLLMLGNGMQGTLLGIRGSLEGFSTFQMSIIMSGYFLGFLGGSRMTPELIRRVGHVRVFAALGSFISAIIILFPAITDPWAWTFLRVLIGFCFSGVYVTAESWLNNAVQNENRGRALSLYLIVQMAGITAAQGLIVLGDPSGFVLFVVPSVLVSISFAPILLSINPTPRFEAVKTMTLRALYGVSPLGCVSVILLGGVFSAQFGMAAVYGTQTGLSVPQISAFISAIYIGGLLLQYPIGWLSDRMDRRKLILIVAVIGGAGGVVGFLLDDIFAVLLAVSFVIGGTSNPLYALALAYTNDMLDTDDMAAASGGLIFMNGVGAIAGPLATGWIMDLFGPQGFWMFIGLLMLAIAGYAGYRMATAPHAATTEENSAYLPVSLSPSSILVESAQGYLAETMSAESDTETTETKQTTRDN